MTVTDENLFQVLTYDRLENTPAGAEASKPKRVLSGDNTLIEFQSGLYIDPKNGDIFAPNNDTVDTLVVFEQGSNGDMKPKRALHTPHGTFGIAVDEKRNEMFLTTQHDSTVVVFRKDADKDEAPLRLLQGDDTGLADPHGIAIDPENRACSSSPITAHERCATRAPGNPYGCARVLAKDETSELAVRAGSTPSREAAPIGAVHLRARAVSQGQRPADTRDQRTENTTELADRYRVRCRATGTVRGKRHGPLDPGFRRERARRCGAQAGVEGAQDEAGQSDRGRARFPGNGELWVSNFGAHSATAYPITAQGDTAPLRIIRAAPESAPSLMIGNPGALTYDSKRQEILVPN